MVIRYCGDEFVYLNAESLCCISEPNRALYFNNN